MKTVCSSEFQFVFLSVAKTISSLRCSKGNILRFTFTSTFPYRLLIKTSSYDLSTKTQNVEKKFNVSAVILQVYVLVSLKKVVKKVCLNMIFEGWYFWQLCQSQEIYAEITIVGYANIHIKATTTWCINFYINPLSKPLLWW